MRSAAQAVHPAPPIPHTLPAEGEALSRRMDRLLPRRRLGRAACRRLAEATSAAVQAAPLADRDAVARAAQELAPVLRREGLREANAIRAFALICEAARLALGQTPRRVQLMGAWYLLRGHLAEMQTGEGKTLAVTLPACAAALAGVPVHLVTANDYLAARDAESMRPLFEALGLQVGAVTGQSDEHARRQAYAADVCYCSSQQLVFDHLHDRLVLGGNPGSLHLAVEALLAKGASARRLLQRGLHFAIVDEADSVLIDEARTPLLLSRLGPPRTERGLLVTALYLGRQLKEGRDYRVDHRHRRVALTPAGEQSLAERADGLDAFWRAERRRRTLVVQALSALHLFVRDRDYLVRDGRVEIIDANTGRAMPDRAWEPELQGLIELKEGLKLSGQREVLARITYQRFFRRYARLAGTTGTASEVSRELHRVYGLRVRVVPPHRPVQRGDLGLRCAADGTTRQARLLDRLQALRAAGRPVLIGTRTLAESEAIAGQLAAAGIPCQLLNARQSAHEARLVAEAGRPGQITIATNMAGRGTDILLPDASLAAGGLHVIATEVNDARRIDRQLFGRCGRQGQPGSHEWLLCTDDPLLQRHLPRALRHWLPRWWPWVAVRLAQRAEERLQRRARAQLLKQEEQLAERLAFTGRHS